MGKTTIARAFADAMQLDCRGYPRSHSKSFSLPVIQKEAVILIQTVILKFLRIVACALEEVKDMLGAQQLLDLLICLPAVTLDGQTGIGIVDVGGNDPDDLIFIIALQIRVSLIKEAVLICSCLLDFLLWGIDVFYLRTGHCKIGVAVIVIAFLNLDITKGGVQIIPLLIHLHHIDDMIFLRGNKKDLETIFQEAKFYEGLIVIIDEVHRLNKDKQDLLLPHVENGNITLIGATTSNPLHAINPAIRSRCHLFEIKQAQQEDIEQALMKAIHHQDGLNDSVQIEEEALHIIARHSNGDIRYSLNILEICALASDGVITQELVSQYSQFPNMSMDSDGDGYYDVLSGFQKSIRGSDVDAALYYLGIMIEANDMDSIERRLLVTAYEDIGLGNPAAVARCATAIDAAKRVGFPRRGKRLYQFPVPA